MQNIKIPFINGKLSKFPYTSRWSTYEGLYKFKENTVWKDNFEITDTFVINTKNYCVGSRYATVQLLDSSLNEYDIQLHQFMGIIPNIVNGTWSGTICYSKHGLYYGCKIVKK